jgi:hypothetical protein
LLLVLARALALVRCSQLLGHPARDNMSDNAQAIAAMAAASGAADNPFAAATTNPFAAASAATPAAAASSSSDADAAAAASSSGGGGDDERVEGADSTAEYKPVVELKPVEVSTGEENDEIVYKQRSACYRFDGGEWKERGRGEVKLLRNKEIGIVRVLLRQEKTLKLCINHKGECAKHASTRTHPRMHAPLPLHTLWTLGYGRCTPAASNAPAFA